MLSKRTKARIARNKRRRATPKKRRQLLIDRTVELATLVMKRLWRAGGTKESSSLWVPPKSDSSLDKAIAAIAFENAIQANQKEEGRMRIRHAAEDRKYFNGWRRGYK